MIFTLLPTLIIIRLVSPLCLFRESRVFVSFLLRDFKKNDGPVQSFLLTYKLNSTGHIITGEPFNISNLLSKHQQLKLALGKYLTTFD